MADLEFSLAEAINIAAGALLTFASVVYATRKAVEQFHHQRLSDRRLQWYETMLSERSAHRQLLFEIGENRCSESDLLALATSALRGLPRLADGLHLAPVYASEAGQAHAVTLFSELQRQYHPLRRLHEILTIRKTYPEYDAQGVERRTLAEQLAGHCSSMVESNKVFRDEALEVLAPGRRIRAAWPVATSAPAPVAPWWQRLLR